MQTLNRAYFLCTISIACVFVSAFSFASEKTPMPASAQKIASAALVSDEITYELLRRKGQLERLVAVSTIADNPTYSGMVKEAQAIPGRVGNEIESLIAQKPDIVFLAHFNRAELIDQINKIGVRTIQLKAVNNFDDVFSNIALIGKTIGLSETANQLIKELKARLSSLEKSKNQKIRLLNFVSGGRVMAADTMADSIIKASGAVNLASQRGLKGWPLLSLEEVLRLDPDWIVVSSFEGKPQEVLNVLRKTPGWKYLNAVKKERLITIKELSSISHFAVDAAEDLFKKLRSTQGL